jgi:hypothetical protein
MGEESGRKRLKEKLAESKPMKLLNFLGTINYSPRNQLPRSLGMPTNIGVIHRGSCLKLIPETFFRV